MGETIDLDAIRARHERLHVKTADDDVAVRILCEALYAYGIDVPALLAHVERLAAERDAAVARAERAEAELRGIHERREPLTIDARTDGAPAWDVVAEILHCASCWEPEARIIGNVRAADIHRALLELSEQARKWVERDTPQEPGDEH